MPDLISIIPALALLLTGLSFSTVSAFPSNTYGFTISCNSFIGLDIGNFAD